MRRAGDPTAELIHLLQPIGRLTAAPLGPPNTTPLGTVSQNMAGGVASVTITPVQVATGELLIVSVGADQNALGARATVSIAGDALASLSGDPGAHGATIGAEIFFLFAAHDYIAAAILIDFTGGGSFPTNCGAIARKWDTMPNTGAGERSANFAVGVGTTQEVAVGAGIPGSKVLQHAVIVTNGRSADTQGAWTAPWSTGQRTGTAGTAPKIDIKEGYFFFSPANGTLDAKITGATSRTFDATAVTFAQVV